MNFHEELHLFFQKYCDEMFQHLMTDEQLSLNLQGEQSLFTRWNHGKIRQLSEVTQLQMTAVLQFQQKTSKVIFSWTLNAQENTRRSQQILKELRENLQWLPEDLAWVPLKNAGKESFYDRRTLFPTEELGACLTQGKQADIVGLAIQGPIVRGSMNSLGQDMWYSVDQGYFDYSIFHPSQKAVKDFVSLDNANRDTLQHRLENQKQQLAIFDRPLKKIPRGSYKAYLAPGAVQEITDKFQWNGFSQRAFQQKQSMFLKMMDGETCFHPHFHLRENFELGLNSRFNSFGEIPAAKIPIIQNGKLIQWLTNSASAQEFGVASNQADMMESFRSLEILPGQLSEDQILPNLEQGLYLSRLHYLNFSDPTHARITGMTRYACFWVQDGQLVAPIEDARFDVSLYDLFGRNLLELTNFQEKFCSTWTFDERVLGGCFVPGVLVQDFPITM
jgi:predicted Zn-dependent protease